MTARYPAAACLATAALLGSAGGARADCLSFVDLQGATASAATVSSPAARTYFVAGGETAGCPADTAACRIRAYVVPHDTVVVVGAQGGYSCALLTTPKGGSTEGWLPTRSLLPLPPTQPVAGAWVGRWRSGDQTIAISAAASGMLLVKGDATSGSHDPERVRRGAVNLGDVEGTAAPQGDRLAFVDGDGKTLPFSDADPNACRIKMQLAGPYLWAWENGCGGMGVSFIGAYARVGG